jgi:hypothetical protein
MGREGNMRQSVYFDLSTKVVEGIRKPCGPITVVVTKIKKEN